jgi:hypothetical protein
LAYDGNRGSSETGARQNAGRPGALPEYRVDPEKRLVTVKFGKKVNGSDIAAYAGALRADPLFDPAFSEIVDLQAVEELNLHGTEMIGLADQIDPFSYTSRRAFVVGNSVQGHAARMHQILRCSKESISIFHSVAEAEKWIQLPRRLNATR